MSLGSIIATNLTSGTAATVASQATASITPVANQPVLLAVLSLRAGGQNTPTATGCGLTWTLVNTVQYGLTSANRLTVLVGVGALPTPGQVTIDWAAQTQTQVCWAVDSFQYGTNSTGLVVQSVTNTAGNGSTSIAATMAAFGSAGNASYGAVGVVVNTGVTPGSGFTELADAPSASTLGLETEWRNDNDTSIDATFLASAAGIIGIELRAIPYVRINRAAAFRTRDRICRL